MKKRKDGASDHWPEHELQIRVRYSESDPMGVLHHSKYFTYFEIARTEMLRSLGGNHRELEESGLLFVVVKANCLYHKPAHYDDLLTIRVKVSRITPAKLEHEYIVWRDRDKIATGHVTLALVDREGNIQRVPQWLRSLG